MRGRFALLLPLLLLHAGSQAQEPDRSYANGVFRSRDLPTLTLCIGAPFRYLGRHRIRIADIAAGERHVFVDAVRDTVRRLIVLQFEGFLPSSSDTYRYGLKTTHLRLGDADYNYDTDYFSISQLRRAAPGAEMDSTVAFLLRHRLTVSDALMQVRFYRVVDTAKRHEAILFYYEALSSHGWTLDQVADSGTPRDPFAWLNDSLRTQALRSLRTPAPVTGRCLPNA
jgi:hypothetical protein